MGNARVHGSEYKKKKKSMLEDLETAKELVKQFMSKSNETNKNSLVLKDLEVVKILSEKKWRICGECMSSNCQLMQHLCKSNKVQKKFLGKCKGKGAKFEELSETLKDIEARIVTAKKSVKQVNTTSVITKVESQIQNDVDDFFNANPDLLNDEFSTRQTKGNSATFKIELKNLLAITEESLPKWKKMKQHKKYKCLICGKRNLTLNRYDEHMTFYHDACLQKPTLEEYQRARDMWILIKNQTTPQESETLTCDYDSELEMRYSEMESENESGAEDSTNDCSEDN